MVFYFYFSQFSTAITFYFHIFIPHIYSFVIHCSSCTTGVTMNILLMLLRYLKMAPWPLVMNIYFLYLYFIKQMVYWLIEKREFIYDNNKYN